MAYGNIIPNLHIRGVPAPYGVVNEREIRAAAGMMFALAFAAVLMSRLTHNPTLIRIVVPLFWTEFFLKTVFDPSFSIFGRVARVFVFRQEPEWVGAIQKRFAWSIGLLLASIMLVLQFALGVQNAWTLSICVVCLTFLWLESACGLCVGCVVYGWMLKKNIIPTPQYRPACPGGACSMRRP